MVDWVRRGTINQTRLGEGEDEAALVGYFRRRGAWSCARRSSRVQTYPASSDVSAPGAAGGVTFSAVAPSNVESAHASRPSPNDLARAAAATTTRSD